MRDRKLENEANGNEFTPLRSERKKRTTSGDSLQFPNGFSGKLLFHLTFNQNFWIFFLLNGKHPMYQFLLFILYTLNTSKVYKVNTFSLTSVLEKALSFAPKMYFPTAPAQDSLCFRNERVTNK